MAEWVEIHIPVALKALDDVAARLADEIAEAGNGTELRDDHIVFWVELKDSEDALQRTRTWARECASRGLPIRVDDIRATSSMEEEDWRDAWKNYFHTTRLTRQLVVVPSWESHTPTDDDIVVNLDPGQAFGTGSHASTQLLLEELQRLSDEAIAPPPSFIDVGCGSGILSIFACKLWPDCSGIAVDIDAAAVCATDENCEKNQLRGRVSASATPIDEIDESFALVLANIQSHVLISLQQQICARVTAGGYLLLSGILTTQINSVVEAYCASGDFELLRTHRLLSDGEWTSATLRRRQ